MLLLFVEKYVAIFCKGCFAAFLVAFVFTMLAMNRMI